MSRSQSGSGPVSGSEDVEAWFAANPHALADGARSVRRAILSADAGVTESVKWQAPSFTWNTIDFATFSMRRPNQLQVILHTGAKARPDIDEISIEAVGSRSRRAGHNREIITFASNAEVEAALQSFERAVRAWIQALPDPG